MIYFNFILGPRCTCSKLYYFNGAPLIANLNDFNVADSGTFRFDVFSSESEDPSHNLGPVQARFYVLYGLQGREQAYLNW